MADVYGNIVTTSDAARFLKDMNRDYYGRKTWEQAFGNIDLAEQQQIGSLGYDYSKAIGEAYAAAYKNQQGIMASNLGQGYKEQAMISNEEALNQAFETYRQNYLSGVSKVETEANKARTELGEQLNTQAENVAKLMNAPFGSEDKEGYVQWLFGQAASDKELNKYLEGNPTFERYFKDVNIEDEKGNITGTQRVMKDPYEIREMLRGEKGYLSEEGTNIYDQLFNLGATVGDKYSFGRWLAESDKDLYDWATKSDVYNFTAAGTNLGTIKELVGMSSTDEVYDYLDITSSLNKEQIEEMTNKFAESAEKISDLLSEENAFASTNKHLKYSISDIEKGITSTIDDIENLTKQLGLYDYAEKQLGVDMKQLFSSINTEMDKLISDINLEDKKAVDNIFNSGKLDDTLAAVLTGASVGSVVPGVGTAIGALSGAVIYGFVNMFSHIVSEPGVTKRTKESREQFKKSYLELATQLSNMFNQLKSY